MDSFAKRTLALFLITMVIGIQFGVLVSAGAAAFGVIVFIYYRKRQNTLCGPSKSLTSTREIPKFKPPPPTDPTRQGLKNSINSTRNQPINRLPVAVDFPRLARKTIIYNAQSKLIRLISSTFT